jgi:hypothetical protein
MEAWIKMMDEEKRTAAERIAAADKASSEREVSKRWRTDTVVRQRDRPPVVTRKLPASEDFINLTDDEAPAAAPEAVESAPPTPVYGSTAAIRGSPARGSPARGRGVTRTPRRHASSSKGSVRKSVEHLLSFYAYKYSLLWNLLDKEGAVYKASPYLAR